MRTCPTCQNAFPDNTAFCPTDGTPLSTTTPVPEAGLASSLARRYRLVKRLGAGGMGTVFLAEQLAVGNRPVALKVLLRKLLDDPEFLQRFRNEAASTGRISHPNVVTIYESGQADDGTPYIAMEYLEGQTLHELLKARGALPALEVAETIQQVARGLNAAHKLGIIHRDLKPDNIFLTRGEEGVTAVKVVDFGIAKLQESSTRTVTGTVLGTPAYMSYEAASGMRSDQLDARSDLYSLGIVAYEMLTGQVPFNSDTPLGFVNKHLSENPPPFRTVKPDLSAFQDVEKVVMKALDKDRRRRQASVLDFARELVAAASPPAKPVKIAEPPQTKPVSAESSPAELAQARLPSVREPAKAGAAIKTPPPAQPSSHARPAPPASALDRKEFIRKGPRQATSQISTGVPDAGRFGSSPASADRAATTLRPPTPSTKRSARLPETRKLPIKAILGGLAVLLLCGVIAVVWHSLQALLKTPRPELKPPPQGMVAIPGGAFKMGRDGAKDSRETPAHVVTVAAFDIDVTPVTNADFERFVKKSGRPAPRNWPEGKFPLDESYWPVSDVSWRDVMDYCQSAGKRLPTEAEWEYAARGDDNRFYPWGPSFDPNRANSLEAKSSHAEAVGVRRNNASPFGVLDMAGNVWQWCEDNFKPYPGNASFFAVPADAKVIRGGSYKSDHDQITTTARGFERSGTRSPLIGFRCAKSR